MVPNYMGTKVSADAAPGGGTSLVLRDPATRAVLDSIRRIVRALRESSRETERSVGLGAAQLFVLQRLAGAPPLSINELADRTLTHQSSVSVVVSRLVTGGLVARTRAVADGRRVEITLTPAGRSLLERAPAAAQDRLIGALGLLGVADRKDLARHLGRLVEAMALPSHHPPMFFERAPSAPNAPSAQKRKGKKTRALPA
jgi:MarR family transcriptional regulator, lower aerobic nicotinate degradation pathway regulator